MLPRFLFAGLLAVLSGPALAQSPTAPIASLPTTPDSIPKQLGRWYLPHYQPSATVADTAGALLSLYATKRANTWWFLPLAPLGLAMLQPSKEYVNDRLVDTDPPAAWQVAIGVPLMVGGVGTMVARYVKYSRSGLAQIQRDYEAGKPIPAKLRRKLKPRHYAQAAIVRVAIVQSLQMEKLRAQQKALRQ
ncbi:hypothetical protein [Hymenobacter sp. B81]|uniref:hypothetical protein n=1 Tax=Hymenobacter sp. B81 TaxID=3344878 RepID=UPI0037DD2AFF